jgi:tRNA(Met) cytidine acetyltransferase
MPLVPLEHLDEVREELVKASKSKHRRLLVIMGDDDSRLMATLLDFLYEVKDLIASEKVLYTYHSFYSDGSMRREFFEKGAPKDVTIEYVSYHKLDTVLGRTYGACIADFINNLEPNDLGKIMGVVRGGGIYIFLMPTPNRLMNTVTRFQSNLIVPGYTDKDLKRYFEKRLLNKLMEHQGIAIYDADNRYWVKKFGQVASRLYEEPKLVFPEKSKIPLKVFRLAVTQDQVEVLKIIENFYSKAEKEKMIFVLTADRGRGKSSAIGIGVGWLAHRLRRAKGRCNIIVTSPSPSNVQEVFRFSRKVLELFKHEVDSHEDEEGFIHKVTAKGIEIEYVTPFEALRTRGDLLVVDEAASIPVPLLFKLLERYNKVIYSSTVHGYEGSGRGFTIRFLHRIRNEKGVKLYEYEMEEPIRYARDDPVERWTFDALLLDAEPKELSQEDFSLIESRQVVYVAPDEEELFLKNEDELRQFFGIYVMAHYRNNPNDLGIMMDAPHHFVRMARLENGKIVVSMELAVEGNMDEDLCRESARGAWLMGNIIPDRVIKHYKILDFGKLKGIRVVRIATHISAMNKGLGSFALAKLEEEAKKKGFDWVGAGFGVTYELLRFWLKNGFVPVHMSPERNPVSGEYSIIVVKPLSEEAKKIVDVIAKEFKQKLLGSLASPYFDLEPEVALLLLEALPDPNPKLALSKLQLARFLTYAWSDMTVENCMDVFNMVTKHYFLSSSRPTLTEKQKLLLVSKILQAKSWRLTCDELNMTLTEATSLLKETAQIFSRHYLGIGSPTEAEKYFYLHVDEIEP